MAIATAAGTRHVAMDVREREQPFEIEVDARPATIVVDPAFDVFRLLDPFETPASIGQIYGQPSIVAVLPSASPAVDRYRELMEGWRTDDHQIEIVLDTDLDALPRDRAAWILGRENRFAGAFLSFDPEAAVDRPGGTVALGGERVPADDRSIVVIRRHPDDPEKANGWISVEPEAAFPGMQRKLPHYGKYSYLAFEGDEPTNVVKGQWETTDSPLAVVLDPGVDAAVEAEPRSALAELPPVFARRSLREHVEWLAAPERRGRGLGTGELDDCAAYIADRFSEAGLEPCGDDGGWFQQFTVEDGPDGRPATGRNVVGILRGTRAGWSDQSIVIGAHYDHLGLGWPDVRAGAEGLVHHGADDNASGVAVLIELARALAAEGGGSCSIVFVAFSAEEAGLRGSRHYVANPCLPAAGIRGMINMDTVGRLSEGGLAIHATGTADEWQHIFRGVGFVTGITGRNVPARVGGSDQDAFIEAGIPA
ncbi:MAG: M20/M25/M40 family metallo-hydrolase, partial [Planctomycetota bacterium]